MNRIIGGAICLFISACLNLSAPALSFAESSSETAIAKVLKTYYPMVGKKLTKKPQGFSVETRGNDKEYKQTYGKWEVSISTNHETVSGIYVHVQENSYQSSPGDKYEKALDIVQRLSKNMECSTDSKNSPASSGNVTAPPRITPDSYMFDKGYVSTTCAPESKSETTCRSANFAVVSVYGYPGIRCIIDKTGTVGKEDVGSAEITIKK